MHSTPPEGKYEDLPSDISLKDFSFEHYYRCEDSVLRPQLEELGYYAIMFMPGEYDDFGPLTRICSCVDPDGVLRKFVYG